LKDENKFLPRVTVLMATYNGEKFLEEQLASIQRQEGVEVDLFVIDDGSTDRTRDLLFKWMSNCLIKAILYSNRTGSSHAFYEGLLKIPTSEFVAFSDQDDIWEVDKLQELIGQINPVLPSLVFSQRSFIDENNRLFGISKSFENVVFHKNSIVENIAYGNTQLINKRGVELLKRVPVPNGFVFDWWVYLLMSHAGNVFYVNKPLVRYRIHRGNQIGLRKLRGILGTREKIKMVYRQAHFLRDNVCSEMTETVRFSLNQFLQSQNASKSPWARFRLLNNLTKRTSKIDQMLMCFFLIYFKNY